MAKTINGLLKISMAMRTINSLTNYRMTKRFVRTSVYCGADYNGESLVSMRPHLLSDNPQELDSTLTIQQAIKRSRGSTQVFNIVAANSRLMMPKDIITAFEVLLTLEQDKPKRTQDICQNTGFLTLCEILKKKARALTPGQCVSVLKVLIYFEVPSTSIIVQTMLQILRNSLNNFKLIELSFIDFLLQKCHNTPLVDALKVAVPIVYESNVVTQLDRDSIHSITGALRYLGARSENPEVLNVILNALMVCEQPMNVKDVYSVMLNLCRLRCCPSDLPEVLKHLQNILAKNVKSLGRDSIILLLQKIATKIIQRQWHYYHEGFIDACASMVISEHWDFMDAMEILIKLTKIGHAQISLLDYITGKAFEDTTLLQTCSPLYIAQLANSLGEADYKPIFWDAVQESITSDRVVEAENINYSFSKLAISLLNLDCYCPKLLARAFREHIEMTSHCKREMRRTLLLYQIVKTLYPQYTGPYPVKFASEPVYPPNKIHHFPLAKSLEYALGGPGYVLSNIMSKLGHRIDHAVVMRKGGFPIAINKNLDKESSKYPVVRLEDIAAPVNSQTILILYIPRYAYTINTQRMLGSWLLMIKSLEALSGHTVIPIQSTMWLSLSEIERVPYLMQAIRLKCDELTLTGSP